MTTDTHIHDVSLTALSARDPPRRRALRRGPRGLQHGGRPASRRDRVPADRAADVAELVLAARAAGLHVAVQGGAHNAGPQGTLENALLIRTNRMQTVHIDPVARRARVEAGVLWETVVDAAARTASPRSTAPRRTSASSATRSAAASAGSPAVTACRPTTSRPHRS